MKKKFLIIQTAFIGDVILATPVINNLYQSNIPIEIDVLVKKENASVLKNHSQINQLFTLDKSSKFSSALSLIRHFRKKKYFEYFAKIAKFNYCKRITFRSFPFFY